jgi:hypothetical protein
LVHHFFNYLLRVFRELTSEKKKAVFYRQINARPFRTQIFTDNFNIGFKTAATAISGIVTWARKQQERNSLLSQPNQVTGVLQTLVSRLTS